MSSAEEDTRVDSESAGGTKQLREERVRGQMSSTSKNLIAASQELLNMTSSGVGAVPTQVSTVAYHREAAAPLLLKSRSSSPDSGAFSAPSLSIPRYKQAVNTPKFKRIDFDDRVYEDVEEKKPAWKQWQDSIKDSYYPAKRQAERNRDEKDFLETTLLSRPKPKRSESPFRNLDSESFLPRKSSWMASGSMQPRDYKLSTSSSISSLYAGSGPYAAPAVNRSQGIESRYESSYETRANDIEARILRTTCLPENLKTITRKEFRRAPAPAAGSATDQDDYDFSMYAPRPYYSRPTREDPDYFDFDLKHSVDLYRRPGGAYTPKRAQDWEHKLLGEARSKGSAPLSGYMFTKGDSDWRCNNSSLLSAALRTPKFWEHRFESIGQEVRDSNPISLESINRNRPLPSRFTEYRDPDYEDYVNPKEDDD